MPRRRQNAAWRILARFSSSSAQGLEFTSDSSRRVGFSAEGTKPSYRFVIPLDIRDLPTLN
jgi:hypothetical protein